MKTIISWGKSVTLLALVLSTLGSLEASATVVPNSASTNIILKSKPTSPQKQDTVQLAQRLVGQCRAVGRSTFVYRERSNANPIRGLQVDEQVTLAEDNGNAGWIAINSPISGFVQTRELKSCSGEPSPSPSRPPRPPVSPRPSTSNLCRQVTYDGTEGLAIRERPDAESPRVGGVVFGDRVRLANPPQFRADNTGREWARLASPTAGWISNGFPSTGDLNLAACS